MSIFKVAVSSRFDELWRYNLVVVCELCSADGKRIEFLSKESFVAPVGSNLTAPPIDYNSNRTITLSCGKGNYLNILVYVIPHTLPLSNEIHKVESFPIVIKVTKSESTIVNQAFEINQWSGDNITLERVGAEKE